MKKKNETMNRQWVKKTQLTIVLGMMLTILFSSCTEKESIKAKETSESTVQASEARGKYLVDVIGCADCHTPKKMTPMGPEPDMDRWLMGFPSDGVLPEVDRKDVILGSWALFNSDLTAAVGPWGVSFSGNLTPDATGIGAWTFDQFKKAMTEGKFKGLENSRPLFPPMPWQSYKNLHEEDLKAIYDYLMTIKPIENVVPAHIPFDEIK